VQGMLQGKTYNIAGDLIHRECCLICSMPFALLQDLAY